MSNIQLIERVELPSSLWLTFWDLDEKEQLSLEIKDPSYGYSVGHIFVLDRDASQEKLALKPLTDARAIARLATLIPVPDNRPGVVLDPGSERQVSVEIRERVEGTMHARQGFLSYIR